MKIKAETMSIVVPCYNEEASLDLFYQAIKKLQTEFSQVYLELILVNDGSKDQTLAKMKTLQATDPKRISYLSFSRNFGKEAAIKAGLEVAKGQWVALMDADLQDPPELLKEMHETLVSGNYDVVATRRKDRAGEPPVRSFFANLYYKLNNLISDVKLEEGARDFRLMTQEVVQAVISLPEINRFSKGIFSWVGFNVAYISYPNVERSAGGSSWSFQKLVSYAVEGLISFSDMPLTIASVLGFISFLFALIYGAYIFFRTILFGGDVAGWPTLVVLVSGLGGMQLLCLGILGKYIGKIFIESKQRPLYIIKEAVLNDSDSLLDTEEV
ncbi:glycosyltransferase family 2 protein [Eremococcus coleocola]|uniref:Glycosyltransferase, group 2 family protein n=1 Tax=Eremococcus coleocola ACS-139-V-Col8 TaxID=908337 RepID=E4KNQ9_9LACT|nr:glycosyltransferase family 2 protein [Eremococcus coleocola]EFR31416.1 glycosyltransferase, group 2 family protein [Eremococcus coleocola ACS-139-V-Col8]